MSPLVGTVKTYKTLSAPTSLYQCIQTYNYVHLHIIWKIYIVCALYQNSPWHFCNTFISKLTDWLHYMVDHNHIMWSTIQWLKPNNKYKSIFNQQTIVPEHTRSSDGCQSFSLWSMHWATTSSQGIWWKEEPCFSSSSSHSLKAVDEALHLPWHRTLSRRFSNLDMRRGWLEWEADIWEAYWNMEEHSCGHGSGRGRAFV